MSEFAGLASAEPPNPVDAGWLAGLAGAAGSAGAAGDAGPGGAAGTMGADGDCGGRAGLVGTVNQGKAAAGAGSPGEAETDEAAGAGSPGELAAGAGSPGGFAAGEAAGAGSPGGLEAGAAAGAGNPGELVVAGVEQCLKLARTWNAWDGRPIARTVDGRPNTWTPHKALRRINDHLIDHLHQVEALLAGAEPVPDTWHGRLVTLDSDWARFTEPDYDEACSRLRRLGRWYVLRYAAAGRAAWDEDRGGAWTLREIAEHVAGVTVYAEQVGSLD